MILRILVELKMNTTAMVQPNNLQITLDSDAAVIKRIVLPFIGMFASTNIQSAPFVSSVSDCPFQLRKAGLIGGTLLLPPSGYFIVTGSKVFRFHDY